MREVEAAIVLNSACPVARVNAIDATLQIGPHAVRHYLVGGVRNELSTSMGRRDKSAVVNF